jgi:DNA oxidative demethylase
MDALTMDLFFGQTAETIPLAPGAYYLPGFALPGMDTLWRCVQQQMAATPPQQMMTPMGYLMSVGTMSMGSWGWVSDAQGYRYSAINPSNNQPWPPLPAAILQLAADAAEKAGYPHFVPDSCLINVYTPGSKMGLHQDKNERDFSQPIISVSLGIPAIFLFGGAKRSDKPARILLQHGDVVVWGGASRRFYHGVAAIKPHAHSLTGNLRINLTLRKAF